MHNYCGYGGLGMTPIKITFKPTEEDGEILSFDLPKEQMSLLKRNARKLYRKGYIKKEHIQKYGVKRDPRNLRDKVAAALGVGIENFVKYQKEMREQGKELKGEVYSERDEEKSNAE